MRRVVPFLPLLLVVACGRSAPPEPFFGDWKVTGASTPGRSAVSADAARGAIGTPVQFSGRGASYGDARCSGPSYTRRWLAPATFTDAYGVEPTELSLSGQQIEFVDVTCETGTLNQGSTLIVRGDGTMLTVWDGAFYVLGRQ
jgi:hypothetical protein